MEFTSTIKLEFTINNHEASSIEEYVEKLKSQFKDDYNIELVDDDITDIEENEVE